MTPVSNAAEALAAPCKRDTSEPPPVSRDPKALLLQWLGFRERVFGRTRYQVVDADGVAQLAPGLLAAEGFRAELEPELIELLREGALKITFQLETNLDAETDRFVTYAQGAWLHALGDE